MNATDSNPACVQPRPEVSLQWLVAESSRCARDLDERVAHLRALLDEVAASPFVARMRQLRLDVIR